MKNPFSRAKDSEGFKCKVCKMAFTTKDSLERHKNKAKHHGDVHL